MAEGDEQVDDITMKIHQVGSEVGVRLCHFLDASLFEGVVICHDATIKKDEFINKFDRVLCDVPCSGWGVIGNKPDIKWQEEDLEELKEIQNKILKTASAYVKEGGILVYSTCTINAEENEKNVERFLSENKDFYAYDYDFGTIKSTKGGYTFLPHVTGTDGFFVARMRKKDE